MKEGLTDGYDSMCHSYLILFESIGKMCYTLRTNLIELQIQYTECLNGEASVCDRRKTKLREESLDFVVKHNRGTVPRDHRSDSIRDQA
jgi:hypothetical protein